VKALTIGVALCVGLVAGCSVDRHVGQDQKADPWLAGYELVWADEFNTDGPPDPANWTYELGFVRNEEAQWYQPDNAACKGGLLVIEARREQKENPLYRPDSRNWRQNRQYAEYTSACITTRRLHSWRYGRFEMRGRIDTRTGLWPAWWMLGISRPWPACGEVDIMEYFKGTLLANAAWSQEGRQDTQWDSAKVPIADFNDPDWSSKFHVWRMDWDLNNIRLYVDGRLLNTVDLDKTSSGGAQGWNPFHQPEYMLLNLAIGGTVGGDPSQTQFPARFEVDYVRVYRRADEAASGNAAS
jgi:beta-glucanase (GH16 family)